MKRYSNPPNLAVQRRKIKKSVVEEITERVTNEIYTNMNNPSRFLCEFDTVDTIAMRNVAEKRKLQEHLDVLEKELHNNLVKMESEMLSIRLENSEVATRKKKAKAPVDIKSASSPSLNVQNGKSAPRLKANQVNSEAKNESETSSRKGLHNVSWPHAGINLPKITTSTFLSARHDFSFGKESPRLHQETVLDRARSLETISELNQKQLYAETNILTSFHRSRSVNSDSGRPPTPQVHSLSQLTQAHAHDQHRRGSWDSKNKSKALLAPLPYGYSPNARIQRVHSAPNIADIVALNQSLGTMRPKMTQGDKQRPTGIPLISENGVQNNAQSRLERAIDFDDIVKTRLGLFKDGIPDENEMKKIRYLRHKGETVDEQLESISSTFDKTLS